MQYRTRRIHHRTQGGPSLTSYSSLNPTKDVSFSNRLCNRPGGDLLAERAQYRADNIRYIRAAVMAQERLQSRTRQQFLDRRQGAEQCLCVVFGRLHSAATL